jgi:FAD/FMN-containing dehydrogenase
VGVVGYSLGGGIGWLARRYGMAANSILAVELVTPQGVLVRADAENEPDLFWALRGGGGNFGIVTAMEFALYPLAEVYAGAMVWDWTESERVLTRWSEWALDAPDEVTTSARILQLPPLPEIPEPLRGRQIVMIDGAYAGDAAAAEPVLRPLRELGPEIDMFATMPSAGLIRVHGDPEHPVPGVSDATMLSSLPTDAVERFVEVAGPGSGSTLVAAELRQLGGALGRPAPRHGALPMLDAEFAVFALGMAINPEMAAAADADARRLTAAMVPWSNGRSYLNFSERRTDAGNGYRAAAYERLKTIRGRVDPDGLLHANHEIPVAA